MCFLVFLIHVHVYMIIYMGKSLYVLPRKSLKTIFISENRWKECIRNKWFTQNTLEKKLFHWEIDQFASSNFYALCISSSLDCTCVYVLMFSVARFEMWMIAAFRFMDFDLQIVSGPRGKTYHMEELYSILDKPFVTALFNFSRSMQELDLTKQEIAILQTIALTFAGMCIFVLVLLVTVLFMIQGFQRMVLLCGPCCTYRFPFCTSYTETWQTVIKVK